MREIKDNSLQYYLLHHSAVLFGTAFISRFIKLLVALNLPSNLGLLTVSSFGLIFLIIWAFWCYQNWSENWSLVERIYRYGMIMTIASGLIVGFI